MLMLPFMAASAQKVVTSEGTYKYYVPTNESLEIAKKKAIEGAKLDAIEKAFGTTVSQSNKTRLNTAKGSDISFNMERDSYVRGEWIETIGEERAIPVLDPDTEQLYIDAVVRGKVRELMRNYEDLKIVTMGNGTDPKRFQTDKFRDGDDLYVYLRSPINGFVSIYLVDEVNDNVVCMLPYRNASGAAYEVKKDKDYVFFSKNKAKSEEKGIVDEYVMSCDDAGEVNDIYVVFSPQSFSKPGLDNTAGQLKTLSIKDFDKWLSRVRNKDAQLTAEKFTITIEK